MMRVGWTPSRSVLASISPKPGSRLFFSSTFAHTQGRKKTHLLPLCKLSTTSEICAKQSSCAVYDDESVAALSH